MPGSSTDELLLDESFPETAPSDSTYSNRWALQDVTGDTPKIGHLREATDVTNGMVYMYAPTQTPKKNCRLFVFNTLNMKVLDLSNRLQYRKRRTSSENTDPQEKKKFPIIDFPSLAMMSSGSAKLLAIIGGYIYSEEDSDGKATSKLFLIDVSDHSQPQWWCQKVEGTAQPRLDATVAVIENKIYLFGGVDKPHGPTESPGVQLRSYSVLEYDAEGRRWRWVASDVPYPTDDVAAEINFGHAIPVYSGNRILLTPPRKAPSYEATFTSRNIFYFDTQNHNFKLAKIMTEDINLPQNLCSYYASSFIPPPNKYPLGSDSEYLSLSPQKRRLLFHPTSSPESVLVCGWCALYEGGHPTPEIWRFFLFPNDRIACLKVEVTDNFRSHRANFHYFTVIDRSIYLLGSEDEEDQDNIDADEKLLDVCLEISFEAATDSDRSPIQPYTPL